MENKYKRNKEECIMRDSIYQKMEQFLKNTEGMMLERDEVMRLLLLVVFAKENIFLYGPPGTGKSLIDRVMQIAFSELRHFRYLMREGASYEDIFGEVVKVDNEQSKRNIENKLPNAQLAFLDETWKSDDAILNSLLTILNEKIFDDTYQVVDVDLYTTVGASNEFPRTKYLAAIFERFPVRIEVPNVGLKESFEALVDNNLVEIVADNIPQFSIAEIEYVYANYPHIKNSKEFKDLLWNAKVMLEKMLNTSDDFEGKAYQVSGRTINKVGRLCSVSAFLNKRDHTDISDVFLCKYILWKNLKERSIVYSVLDNLVFGDKHNILEDVQITLKTVEEEMQSFRSSVYHRVIYRVLILDVKEFDSTVASCEQKKRRYVNILNELENKIQLFIKNEQTYQIIDKNIFLYAPNVVPWRAMTEERVLQDVNEFQEVVREYSGGKYYDLLLRNQQALQEDIKAIDTFLAENYDYFDYQHLAVNKGLMES